MDFFNLNGRSFHLLGNLEDDGFGQKMWQTQKDVRCGWCCAWQSLWAECLCAHAGMGCCTVTAGWPAFHVPQRCVSHPYGGAGDRPVPTGQVGHGRPVILRRSKESTLGTLAECPAFTSVAISSFWPEETVRGGRIRAVNKSKIQHS